MKKEGLKEMVLICTRQLLREKLLLFLKDSFVVFLEFVMNKIDNKMEKLEYDQLISIDGGTEEGAYEMGKAIGEGIAAGLTAIGIIAFFLWW